MIKKLVVVILLLDLIKYKGIEKKLFSSEISSSVQNDRASPVKDFIQICKESVTERSVYKPADMLREGRRLFRIAIEFKK